MRRRRIWRRPPRLRAILLVATLTFLAPIPMAPAEPGDRPCFGDTEATAAPNRRGPALRFGINPGAGSGQLGRPARSAPEKPERTLAALSALRPPGRPFVVRLNGLSWSAGEQGIERYAAVARRYTKRGFLVELQLRYHPRPDQQGDVASFTGWVRQVVSRLGANPRVVAVQVANEVNLEFSPHSSDGAYPRAREALIHGVIAAKQETVIKGYRQLKVGFNWFYRTDPLNEDAFWGYLAERGGASFAAAVDWVGLDAYPGTHFPPVTSPGTERGAMVNALSVLRECFLPVVGIAESVPIHVEENGYPTGPGRSHARQAQALSTMVRAVNDYRGTYNVTDYRWFNLRDADSSSPTLQQQHGLLRDDYRLKPAFATYRQLVHGLTGPGRAAAN